MKKKLLAVLLTLCLLIGLLPVGVWAIGNYVAEVNGTKYTELQTAINAANAGDTVALLRDIAYNNGYVLINKNLTLNLGKHTITNTADGTSVIFDGGTNAHPAAALFVRAETGTHITVTIEATTGGIVTAGTGRYAITSGNMDEDTSETGSSNLTVNGGKYEAKNADVCIYQIMGTTTINDGTYKAAKPRTVLNGKRYYFSEFSINGGSFYGFNPECVSIWTGSSGAQSTNYYHQHDILAAGKAAKYENGWYTVIDGARTSPKVKTKSLCFPAAGVAIHAVAAMNDVANLGIITLEADATLTVADAQLAIDYGFSFVLNGHTLTPPAGYRTYDTNLSVQLGGRAVTKIEGPFIAGVALDKPTASVYIGGTVILTATMIPETIANKTVTWTSSDESVATVDENGKVTGVAVGTAIITVTTEEGSYTDSCTVTVAVRPVRPSNFVSPEVFRISTSKGVVSPYRSASEGTTVTFTVKPEEGFTLAELSVICGGDEIKLTQISATKYSFEMPDGPVTIDAEFAEIVEVPYTDLDEGEFYYDAVLWALQNDVLSEITGSKFQPLLGCTRGEAMDFLWRAAGKPMPKGENPFVDVADDDYAILWAVENGITLGTSTTEFTPDRVCARSEIITFLYRFAGEPNVPTVETFDDVEPGAYYEDAVQWAVLCGITKGDDSGFNPTKACDRGEIITFLYRHFN